MYPTNKSTRTFNLKKFIQNALVLIIIVLSVIFSIRSGSLLLKVLAIIAISVVGTMIISDYIFSYFVANYNLASIVNELLYLFIGIPIGVIAATYLPLSIYIAFFRPKSIYIVVTVFVLLGVLQVASISYLIRQRIRDQGMYSMKQYLKFLFDFKRRKQEAEMQQKRTEQIDDFYSRFGNVHERIAQMRKEKETDVDHFNWKKELGAEKEEE